jgi:murein DD-endopeptidase MepM/ murein hydrolase activator NlpD
VGQSVNKGQQIGSMGNTGQTYSLSGGTGSHLDYRIVDMYGKYVNPYKFISS